MQTKVQTVATYCTSVWCMMAGLLIDGKDLLSAISILIGILVGFTALIINIKRLSKSD